MTNTREKLIELLSYFADGYSVENKHIVDGTKVCEIANHLIANGVGLREQDCHWATEQAYKNGYEKGYEDGKPKWIPVTERLPEDDLPQDTDRKQIRCLVATNKGTVKPCVRQRYQKKIDGQWQLCEWEWNKDLFAKPTHWMLMPQPPKGE